ncbi:MAG: phosphatidylglycerol lysyltransferase domain-containing protein [Oscillospiraceae bacterium]|nr:phosphatidylglycerol lysyltransferase domain-containing protein [Oscillospiraceae bacterium]
MIELQEITIDNKDLIDRYLKLHCIESSEFTFTNLFMWRLSYDIKYAVINDLLCFFPQHTSGPRSSTFPAGDVSREDDVRGAISEILNYFKEIKQPAIIRLCSAESVELLHKLFPNEFKVTEDENMFDYVYSISELISLSGKKFHQKRNHINKFKSLYDFEYRKIGKENLIDCINLFNDWYIARTDEGIDVSEGKEAFDEFAANFKRLNVRGGGIYVYPHSERKTQQDLRGGFPSYKAEDDGGLAPSEDDNAVGWEKDRKDVEIFAQNEDKGKLVAFSFGEPLCAHTVVIHFEVADTNYQGAFPMINQQFLENEWSEYQFVNREEDMGLEGLRRAKRSYNPVTMINKYVATLKSEASAESLDIY